MEELSILDERLYGVVYITGHPGVGKTTLATTAENPKLTAIIDFDLKFEAEAKRLGFWYRRPDHAGQDVFGFDFPRTMAWFRSTLDEIPAGTKAVVFDNAAPLEGLLGYIVSQSPEKYGVSSKNAQTGSYGGVNPGISKLWKNIVLYLQGRGVKVIFVISHLGSPWINGQPVPNRFRGKGSKALQELSNLSLVLVRERSYIPAGIVLKEQLAQRTFGPDGWKVRRVLPLRFPRCQWGDIFAYFDNPADFEKPKAGEVPTPLEVDMFGELLSNQQLEFIKSVAGGTYVEDGDAPEFAASDPQPASPQRQPKKAAKALEKLTKDEFFVKVKAELKISNYIAGWLVKSNGLVNGSYNPQNAEKMWALIRDTGPDLQRFIKKIVGETNYFATDKEILTWLDQNEIAYDPENEEFIFEQLAAHADKMMTTEPA